jgi:hypothetical protein
LIDRTLYYKGMHSIKITQQSDSKQYKRPKSKGNVDIIGRYWKSILASTVLLGYLLYRGVINGRETTKLLETKSTAMLNATRATDSIGKFRIITSIFEHNDDDPPKKKDDPSWILDPHIAHIPITIYHVK